MANVMTHVPAEKQHVPILMYHSISNRAQPRFKKFTVSVEHFSEQMSYLRQHNYNTITVTQFVRAIARRGQGIPDRPVILTFDDGFADFYTRALPILKRYNFTATLYIATAFVGATSLWLEREGEATRPMLTWAQLVNICANGIECGAHSHSHPHLDTLPLSVAYDEIARCKDILERRLALEVTTFAYPFGHYDATIQRIVQEIGYSSACAVKYATSSTRDDPFALARLIVTADTEISHFAGLLTEGGLSIAQTWHRLRAWGWQLTRHRIAQLKRRW